MPFKPSISIKWAFAIFIVFAVLSWGNSVSSPVGQINTQQMTQGLIDQFNQHTNLVNSDAQKMAGLYSAWVSSYNNAIKDNVLTSSEITEMKTSIDNYASEYNYANQHLLSFKSFVTSNEQILKSSTTVDTFKTKTSIDDMTVSMQNNANYMTTKTQELVTNYQAQQQQLQQLLQILLGLI